MKAMLLAAGEGSRLRPLTLQTPKPMLPIAGTPILEHNVRLLASHGVDHIVINVHYHAETIVRHFGDGSRFGVAIDYSYEDRLLGTAGGLKKVAAAFTDESFFLVFGDNLTTLDLGALAGVHEEHDATLTMALFERDDPRSSGIVAIDETDRIVQFVEKPSADEVFSHWVNAGYLVLNPRVLSRIPADRASDIGRDLIGALIEEGEGVFGYRMTEQLWWIDSIEDYERTTRTFRQYKESQA